jgi:hypothetical protein
LAQYRFVLLDQHFLFLGLGRRRRRQDKSYL